MSKTRHFLLAGLGNYTHPNTRHSVGQTIIESLARRFQVSLDHDRGVMGWIGEADVDVARAASSTKGKGRGPIDTSSTGDLDGPNPERVRLTFLKPKLLMNVSGKSISMALRSKVQPPKTHSVIVIHDSLEHRPLFVSPKSGGSANGHNGVRSTIEALGGADFHRIRIGIGRGDGNVADYVLQGLTPKELRHWSDAEGSGVTEVWTAIERIMAGR